jgi:hypothetical protein
MYAWSFNANTTSASATVKIAQTSGIDFVLDVLALAGNDTSAPIVQSNGSESGCNKGGCNPKGTTASASLTNATATGDVSVEIIGSDDTIGGALTWSAGSTNLFNSSGANASLGTYLTSPAAQTDTASTSGFGTPQDWATIALEINNG